MPELPRAQLAAAAAAVLVVVVLGVRWIQAQAPVGPGAAPGAARGSGGPPGGAGADGDVRLQRTAPADALVHVAGAVRHPGVFLLHGDARVRDAVRRAGGATRRGDPDAINLAAKVADGQQVVVPARGPAAGGPAGAGAGPGAGAGAAAGRGGGAGTGVAAPPVSLSSATVEQLDALDGVGPATAQKILAYRDEHGGFPSVDDLAQVPGIGPKRLEALRPHLQP